MNLIEILEGLMRQPSWNINRFEQVGATVQPQPWYEVDGKIAATIVLREDGLEQQIAELPGQIQFWGHLEALCDRAVEWEERQLRVWKAKIHLEAVTPPANASKDWKKPTEATVEAMYRTHPEYERLQTRIDRAREATTATKWVREAWVAKAQLMKIAVRRGHDDAMSVRA